jgi:hypothetical protein
MSLRIIIKPDQIEQWMAARHGTPARLRNTDADLRILFGENLPDYETISTDQFHTAMKFNQLALLVDEEPGKTFHKFVKHA